LRVNRVKGFKDIPGNMFTKYLQVIHLIYLELLNNKNVKFNLPQIEQKKRVSDGLPSF